MKKLFLFCLFLASFFTNNAQLPKLGIKRVRTEGELLATDPMFTDAKRHYQTKPFDLKAGQGIVFFMQSTAFTPYITLMGKDGKTFGMQRPLKTENCKEARVAFAGIKELYLNSKIFDPGDSSFQLVLTSAEDNATGKFTYGFKLIDSAQMIYDHGEHSFCKRLYYLINQWQADWDIIPNSVFDSYLPHSNDHELTDFCLFPSKNLFEFKSASLNPDYLDKNCTYNETLFDSSWGVEALFFYSDIVDEIKKCLGEKNLVFEEKTGGGEDIFEERRTSYFYFRGAGKDQKGASFKVVYTHPVDKENTRVVLIFD